MYQQINTLTKKYNKRSPNVVVTYEEFKYMSDSLRKYYINKKPNLIANINILEIFEEERNKQRQIVQRKFRKRNELITQKEYDNFGNSLKHYYRTCKPDLLINVNYKQHRSNRKHNNPLTQEEYELLNSSSKYYYEKKKPNLLLNVQTNDKIIKKMIIIFIKYSVLELKEFCLGLEIYNIPGNKMDIVTEIIMYLVNNKIQFN